MNATAIQPLLPLAVPCLFALVLLANAAWGWFYPIQLIGETDEQFRRRMDGHPRAKHATSAADYFRRTRDDAARGAR